MYLENTTYCDIARMSVTTVGRTSCVNIYPTVVFDLYDAERDLLAIAKCIVG